MTNSNAIRSALKIMNRVLELRYAGLKLKESKSDLRVILLELRNELPAEILFNVEQVLRRRAGRDFFNQLSTVIYCAEAALRVAEQMDGYHAEALRMNEGIDLAFKIGSLLSDCKYGIEGAMSGALYRDGFDEIDYLVQVAARKHAQRGTGEITAYGI